MSLKNSRKLCYIEYGDPKGFPVFFFHGWPGSRLQGDGMHEIASRNKIRLIATDRPGFGLSDYYETRTLLDWPDDIVSLASHLNIKKFSILGNSGGGPYVAACAFKIPQYVHKAGISVGLSPTNVKGVLRGMAFHNQALWFLYHYIPLLMKLNAYGFYVREKLFPSDTSFTFSSKADQAMLTEDVKKCILKNRHEAFRQGIKGVAQDLKLYTHDWGFSLENIHAKVYLWYGALDKSVPTEMGKYYEKHIPHAKLTIYPDVGHLLLTKYSEDVLKELASPM